MRFVKSGSWLGLAEYISDAVVTNAVARAEISVRVVIEGAPADAAGILRIGSELVVDASVAQRMLGEAFYLVDGLRGIGVPDKFRIQVARMVGRL